MFVRRGRDMVDIGREHEEKQRAIVSQRKAPDHSPRLSVHDVGVLVARPITAGLKRRDGVAETLLERVLRSERQPSNRRMQSICPYNQIISTLTATS